MNNYFEEYKKSKKTLLKMVSQFFKYDNNPETCFHMYKPDGIIAWQLLGLEDGIILQDSLYDIYNSVDFENESNDINYYLLSMKYKILIAQMIINYYSKTIPIEEAEIIGMDYEKDYYYNLVDVCDNYGESAGEGAWHLLEIEENPVDSLVVKDMILEITNKLLNNKKTNVKVKK